MRQKVIWHSTVKIEQDWARHIGTLDEHSLPDAVYHYECFLGDASLAWISFLVEDW